MEQPHGDDGHTPSPTGRSGQPAPHELRISDAERHQVAEVLRQAAGEGRIDLDELDERLEAAFRAKTYAELVPLTADLPVPGGRPAPAAVARQPVAVLHAPRTSFAVMSETKRRGAWQVGDHHGALALMGSIVLDLREAVFTSPEVVVQATAVMGSIEVIVNPETVVVCEGFGFMGSFTESRSRTSAEPGPTAPVVRVKGLALMGSVDIKRRPVQGRVPRLGKGH